jgi:hypothetical protein
MSRRDFGGLTLGTAALLAPGRERRALAAMPVAATQNNDAPWLEATTPELQASMRAGRLISRELTVAYLERFHRLDAILGSVRCTCRIPGECLPRAWDFAHAAIILSTMRRTGRAMSSCAIAPFVAGIDCLRS